MGRGEHLCYKYFRLLKLLGANAKGGRKLGSSEYCGWCCTLTEMMDGTSVEFEFCLTALLEPKFVVLRKA